MAQPYVGEIRMFAGNYAPIGWLFCDGQLLPISENETLFTIIGTSFGGDGQETFALPDLRGRVPIHKGPNFPYASNGGVESVTLTVNQIPAHTHAFVTFNATANSPNPSNNLLGLSTQGELYYGDIPSVSLNAQSITPVGGSQPHENMMPFVGINFIISLFGLFPQPT
jgi:microcystin-dependent protein